MAAYLLYALGLNKVRVSKLYELVVDRRRRCGTDAHDSHQHGARDQRDENPPPLSRRAVDQADNHGTRTCDEVPVGLHETGQAGRHHMRTAACGDEGDGGREAEAADTEEEGPEEGQAGAVKQKPQVPAGGGQGEHDDERGERAGAGDEHWHDQPTDDVEAADQRQRDRAGRRGGAVVAVDLRQPAHLDVRVHRLDAEEDEEEQRRRRAPHRGARGGGA